MAAVHVATTAEPAAVTALVGNPATCAAAMQPSSSSGRSR